MVVGSAGCRQTKAFGSRPGLSVEAVVLVILSCERQFDLEMQ